MEKLSYKKIKEIISKSDKHKIAVEKFAQFIIEHDSLMSIAYMYAKGVNKYSPENAYTLEESLILYSYLPSGIQVGYFLEFIAHHFGESEPLHSFYSDFKQTIDACFDQIATGNDKMQPDNTTEKNENQNAENADQNINQNNEPKFVWATSVGNLRKALKGLEDERMIMTQLCAANGKVANLFCKFYIEAVGGSSISFFNCEHPELIDFVCASDIKDGLPNNQRQPKNILGEWQLCPKCHGEKKVPSKSGSSCVFDACDICNQAGILAKPVITNH